MFLYKWCLVLNFLYLFIVWYILYIYEGKYMIFDISLFMLVFGIFMLFMEFWFVLGYYWYYELYMIYCKGLMVFY